MMCVECDGDLNINLRVSIKEFDKIKNAYPCSSCGRLYYKTGEPALNSKGEKIYINLKNKKLILI